MKKNKHSPESDGKDDRISNIAAICIFLAFVLLNYYSVDEENIHFLQNTSLVMSCCPASSSSSSNYAVQ